MSTRDRGSRLFLMTTTFALIAAPAAQAHLMNTGFGPFYDGLMHFLITPEDLLPVVALALFAGLQGPALGRIVLFALPLAWLTGSIAGLLDIPRFTVSVMMTLATIALGILLAADKPLPPALIASIAILLGLLHGSADGSEIARRHSSEIITAGVAIAICIIVSLLAGQAASIKVGWARVALRVVGSWIAAIGILMLGWSLRVTS
jgi:urease accessory protein